MCVMHCVLVFGMSDINEWLNSVYIFFFRLDTQQEKFKWENIQEKSSCVYMDCWVFLAREKAFIFAWRRLQACVVINRLFIIRFHEPRRTFSQGVNTATATYKFL